MKYELIVITPQQTIANELAWMEKLFKAGLKKLHVRKPGFSKSELQKYISMVPRKYHSRIVIHSHYSLIAQFSLGGIHLTEKSKRKKIPSTYDPGKHTLSASFHSTKDIEHSRRRYDYVFLSPVFDSISKKGYKRSFDEKALLHFLAKYKNIIALGGIDPASVRKAMQMKFRGVATLGYIWEAKDPVKAFQKLRSKIK
jgi:thiamine-phosphate pyrophosphorylase